jgi:hypothetical protein
MAATFGDLLTLSKHDISPKATHDSASVLVSCSKGSKTEYATTGVHGEGINIVDVWCIPQKQSAHLTSHLVDQSPAGSCDSAGARIFFCLSSSDKSRRKRANGTTQTDIRCYKLACYQFTHKEYPNTVNVVIHGRPDVSEPRAYCHCKTCLSLSQSLSNLNG